MRRLMFLVTIGLLIAQGCARQKAALSADHSDTARQKIMAERLEALARMEAEIKECEQRLVKFHQDHPDFEPSPLTNPDELAQLSEIYLRAIVALLEAQAEYPPGHPKVVVAAQTVEGWGKQYAQAVEVSALTAEYERLEAELVMKQMFYGRLQSRVRGLELSGKLNGG